MDTKISFRSTRKVSENSCIQSKIRQNRTPLKKCSSSIQKNPRHKEAEHPGKGRAPGIGGGGGGDLATAGTKPSARQKARVKSDGLTT